MADEKYPRTSKIYINISKDDEIPLYLDDYIYMERYGIYSLGKMLSYDPIKGQGIAEITAYSDMEDGPHTVFINSKYAYFVGNALFIEIRTIPDSEEILEEDIKDVEDNEKHLQQINFIKNAKAEEDLI